MPGSTEGRQQKVASRGRLSDTGALLLGAFPSWQLVPVTVQGPWASMVQFYVVMPRLCWHFPG